MKPDVTLKLENAHWSDLASGTTRQAKQGQMVVDGALSSIHVSEPSRIPSVFRFLFGSWLTVTVAREAVAGHTLAYDLGKVQIAPIPDVGSGLAGAGACEAALEGIGATVGLANAVNALWRNRVVRRTAKDGCNQFHKMLAERAIQKAIKSKEASGGGEVDASAEPVVSNQINQAELIPVTGEYRSEEKQESKEKQDFDDSVGFANIQIKKEEDSLVATKATNADKGPFPSFAAHVLAYESAKAKKGTLRNGVIANTLGFFRDAFFQSASAGSTAAGTVSHFVTTVVNTALNAIVGTVAGLLVSVMQFGAGVHAIHQGRKELRRAEDAKNRPGVFPEAASNADAKAIAYLMGGKLNPESSAKYLKSATVVAAAADAASKASLYDRAVVDKAFTTATAVLTHFNANQVSAVEEAKAGILLGKRRIVYGSVGIALGVTSWAIAGTVLAVSTFGVGLGVVAIAAGIVWLSLGVMRMVRGTREAREAHEADVKLLRAASDLVKRDYSFDEWGRTKAMERNKYFAIYQLGDGLMADKTPNADPVASFGRKTLTAMLVQLGMSREVVVALKMRLLEVREERSVSPADNADAAARASTMTKEQDALKRMGDPYLFLHDFLLGADARHRFARVRSEVTQASQQESDIDEKPASLASEAGEPLLSAQK